LAVNVIANYSMDRMEGAILLYLREVYFGDYQKLLGIRAPPIIKMIVFYIEERYK
jgi:hypothetical protein